MKSKYICLVFLVGMSSMAYSQDIYNGTSIFIPNSTDIYVGDLNNSGFIQNNGTIEITGDWKNRNVYQGLGTIVLSGKNQEIDNNDQAIQQLLIEGGGVKSLEGKLLIHGSLDLVSGIIEVSKSDTLLIREGATIEGGSIFSFVDGPLIHEGTGYRFFPVGRDGSYYPITLTEVTGVKPIIQVAAFKDFPEVTTSRDIVIDQSSYWKISGTHNGSPVMIEKQSIAFLAGNSFDDEFEVIETNGNGVSKTPITQSIIASGVLVPEPIQPTYLSTTLSPHAQNHENRLVKFFGTEAGDGDFSFSVFNRWGSLLFESMSLTEMTTDGWDGTHNGQLVPAGAYPYKLSYVDREGREDSKTGFITIVY